MRIMKIYVQIIQQEENSGRDQGANDEKLRPRSHAASSHTCGTRRASLLHRTRYRAKSDTSQWRVHSGVGSPAPATVLRRLWPQATAVCSCHGCGCAKALTRQKQQVPKASQRRDQTRVPPGTREATEGWPVPGGRCRWSAGAERSRRSVKREESTSVLRLNYV